MKRLEIIKEITIKKPYIYSFFIILIAYLVITIIVNKFYIVAPYLKTYNLKIVIPYLTSNLIVAILVAININLIYFKFKEVKRVEKSSSLTFFGVFSGMLGGLCPGCIAGLFPLISSFFGISLSLASLPFKGLELQTIAITLLIISITLLTRKQLKICKIKEVKSNRR